MNYYEEISKMLGVEPGEEFKLSCKKDYVYKITLDGLMIRQLGESKWYESVPSTLTHLFKGDYSVVKLPWKPKKGVPYWYYSEGWKEGTNNQWKDDLFDLMMWKIGNVFKTKEEAETKGKDALEQVRKEFEES